MKNSTVSCVDIVSCLLEDHDELKRLLAVLHSHSEGEMEKREALHALVPLLSAHTHAEEEVVISRALEIDELRLLGVEALEEHELAETEVERIKQSADSTQFLARVNVLSELIEHHLKEEEEELFPELQKHLSSQEREEMGVRYRGVKDRNVLAPVLQMPMREALLTGETGRVGYIIAWLLGVPFWILLLIFLIRGH